jgi:hypothetical protein
MLIAALPILIELFTSEGCSSCPPADATLARLQEKQPAPGVELIVLSEHVDYWNDLGWRDPFSDRLFSDRQSRYGGRTYTPQAIVDGRVDVLGSDESGIVRAAVAAAGDPHGRVELTGCVPGVHKAGNTPTNPEKKIFFSAGRDPLPPGCVHGVHVAVTGLPPHGPAQVLLAVVEDGLVSKVLHGENEGRTLAHSAVVRSLKSVGSIGAAAAGWEGDVQVPSDPEWKRTRLIVFVQDRERLRILAAGSM